MVTEHQNQIESRSIPVPESGCWLWLGVIGRHGYGRNPTGQAKQYEEAHRASFRAYKGEIPSGLLVRHTCDTRSCVNPQHLLLGTVLDNIHDMHRRRRHPQSDAVLSDRCRAGHLLSGANLRMWGSTRFCKTCERARCAAKKRAEREVSA